MLVMIKKSDFLRFDEVFPQTKNSKSRSKAELIKLAKKVASALKKESEELAEQERAAAPPGFFSTSPQ